MLEMHRCLQSYLRDLPDLPPSTPRQANLQDEADVDTMTDMFQAAQRITDESDAGDDEAAHRRQEAAKAAI